MKAYFRKLILVIFLFGLGLNSLNAETWTVKTVPNIRLSNAKACTSDPDDLIDPTNQAEIDRLLYNAQQQLTAEIFVVALKSTGDVDLKSFATELFNEWGIGKKGKDNGLLILLVLDQRKVTMETGYGMEGVFPDATCIDIINNNIVPLMQKGQIGAGMLAGVQAVLNVAYIPANAAEIKADPAVLQNARFESQKSTLITVLILYLLLTVIALFFSSKGFFDKLKRTSVLDPYEAYKVLNTSMTGYQILAFIFPLTMLPFFLSYKKKINSFRKKPRACPQCDKPLLLMSEKQEDAYLNAGQQSEEMVGSVDYDAWICMDCGYRSFLSYTKSFTRYQPCPKCHFKTYAQTSDRIVSSPTPISAGQGVHVYTCANCGYEALKYYVIPMIIILPSTRGGGGFGGGGGGSFGGGSSGGGGATGGW